MLIFCLRQERIGRGEFFEYAKICGRGAFGSEVFDRLEGRKADEISGDFAVVEVFAVVANRTIDFQLVLQTGDIVLRAVPRGSMNRARAAVGRDIVGQNDWRRAINERCLLYTSPSPRD